MKTKMKRYGFKFTSAFLAFLMVFYLLPVTVFADMLDTEDANIEFVQPEMTASPELENDVFEVTDKRTANTKTFHLSDGTYYVAQYVTDVHYMDENNVWQDIDNRLILSGSEITTSNAKIKFAKKTTGNSELFTLHDGNRKLTLSLDGAKKKVEGQITNHVTEWGEDATQLQKMTTLDQISASVLYANILNGVDLEYVINGRNIKENIIVKERSDAYSYSFTLSLNNLNAALNQDGEVIISDSDSSKVVYVIPAPVMWDANNTFSTAASMSLTSLGMGKYTLTVTADSSWMNAEERTYPVTIDPPIYTNSSSSVVDLDIRSSKPNDSFADSTTLYVSDEWRTYWKITDLPELPNSAYITDAQFTMTLTEIDEVESYVAVYEVLNGWDSSLTWNKTIHTTSPQGRAATHYTDYRYICSWYDTEEGEYVVENEAYTWNITPIVKNWYAGSNYGLMFAPASGTTSTGIVKFFSNDDSTASARPQLCITYRDMKGLENYWSYASQSAGFAGTGSVNYATGNLVFTIPTLSTIDSLMPITPTLVYNSCIGSTGYTSSSIETSYIDSHMPKGFKLSIQETIVEKTYIDAEGNSKIMYVWTDGDGTDHYFLETSEENVYADEDGLHLKLERVQRSLTITDDDWNVREFTKYAYGWILTKITDKSGNWIAINTNGYLLTSLSMTPAGDNGYTFQLYFVHNDNNDLIAIWNPHSNEAFVLHCNSNNYLTKITRLHSSGTLSADILKSFYNGTSASSLGLTVDAIAKYTFSNGLLSNVDNQLSDYKLQYYYEDDIDRVSEVIEYGYAIGATEKRGQRIWFSYNTSSTRVRSSGTDDVMGTTDDLYTNYCFDYNGRVISSYTTDLSSTKLYGASTGQYESEQEKAKNSLKSSVVTAQQSSNYLLNGGFEEGSAYWSTLHGNVNYAWSGAFEGEYNAMLSISASNTSSVTYQDVYLKKGDYTLSLYAFPLSAAGASVKIRAKSLSNSSHNYVETIPVNEYNAGNGYVFFSLSFAVDSPENFRISIEVSGNTIENVLVDNVMLSKTLGASEYDMVQMGHFENSSSTTNSGAVWSYLDNTNSNVVTTDVGGLFNQVMKIDTQLTRNAYPTQTVYQASETLKSDYYDGEYTEDEPMLFTISGWGKGTMQSYNASNKFALHLSVQYVDTMEEATTEDYYLDFDKGITDWQFVSGCFATNPDYGMVDIVTVSIEYFGHAGVGYFDNISLVRDSNNASIYGYTDAGYISSYKSGKNYSNYQYNSDNLVSYMESSNKTWTSYSYDSNKRVSVETSGTWSRVGANKYVFEELVHTYSYNEFGLLEQDRVVEFHGAENATQSDYTYYESGAIIGALKTETDSLGNTTEYFVDESNGRLLAVLYPEGDGVCYTYDGMGNLTLVLPASVSTSSAGYSSETDDAMVDYVYDAANRLSSIQTASTEYSFTYDVFGNSTSVKAGDYTLASYTYNANNGKMSTLTYGNGLVVKYLYDALDRVKEIVYNTGEDNADVTAYTYAYDSAGNLHRVEDHINDTVTVYKYDLEGKLTKSYTYDSAQEEIINSTQIGYDEQSRVNYLSHTFDYTYSSSYVQSGSIYYRYSYDEQNKKVTQSISFEGLSGTVVAEADMFGRASYKTVDFSGKFYNRVSYIYHSTYQDMATVHSGRVSTYESTAGLIGVATTTTTFHYEYDDNGNITQILDDEDTVLYQYTYDDLGQLTREDNRPLNKSYLYIYDDAGNRVQKRTYAFTTGTLGTATYIEYYNYDDGAWGDLLTSFSLTYDESGNPITIYGYADLIWQGRELIQYYDWEDGYTYDYTYNADGIRTSKTIDGVLHEFILSGDEIVAEIWTTGSTEHMLVYLYDEVGSPIGLMYRNNTYASSVYDSFFFEKNLQGDVIAVYDSTGTKIGSYTYDAWGNFTTTVTSGNTTLENNIVRNYNPFRYRSYFYDIETGWYYLQSRYYNPSWGRFLSADHADVLQATPDQLTDKNLFAYCDNNPITRLDEDGEFWNVVIGAVVGGVIGGITTALTGGTKEEVLLSMACGAISGGFAATGFGGLGAQMMVGALTSSVDSGFQNYNDYKDGEITLDEAIKGTLVDGTMGATFAAMGFEGTDAFEVSNKMAKSAHKSLKALFKKPVHPAVSRESRKVLKQCGKYIVKEFKSSLSDNILTSALGYGVGELFGCLY